VATVEGRVRGEFARYSAARDWSMACDKARTSIRVITLDTSVDRRRAFTQMSRDTKLDWAFFPAHTRLTEPLRYSARATVRRSGRPLSPAEVGCYTSHFKIWEWLSNSDLDQAIIFEDDVIVDWALIEKLVTTRFSDYGVGLLRLHTYGPFCWKIVKYKFFSSNNHLVRLIGMVPGAAAHVLSKAAARTLVSKYSFIAAPLDWVLSRYWEHGVINYCMFPFPVVERDGPSTIGDERYAVSQRAVVNDRVARIGWRISDRAKRALAEHCLIQRFPLGSSNETGPPFIPAEPEAAMVGRAPRRPMQN
jgi:glycosyl transferase, family 25